MIPLQQKPLPIQVRPELLENIGRQPAGPDKLQYFLSGLLTEWDLFYRFCRVSSKSVIVIQSTWWRRWGAIRNCICWLSSWGSHYRLLSSKSVSHYLCTSSVWPLAAALTSVVLSCKRYSVVFPSGPLVQWVCLSFLITSLYSIPLLTPMLCSIGHSTNEVARTV